MTVDQVIFNTASDSFQAHPDILDITFQTMKILLERGVSLSVLTKGWIPDRERRMPPNAGRHHLQLGLLSSVHCPIDDQQITEVVT